MSYTAWTIQGAPHMFRVPGHSTIAYVYGEKAVVMAAVAHWPKLVVAEVVTEGAPDEDDYALPAGALRLYLDLCATYGDPA